jgi:hypothetical protein
VIPPLGDNFADSIVDFQLFLFYEGEEKLVNNKGDFCCQKLIAGGIS